MDVSLVVVGFGRESIDSRALATSLAVLKPEPYVPYSLSDSSIGSIFPTNKDVVFGLRIALCPLHIRAVPFSSHSERMHP